MPKGWDGTTKRNLTTAAAQKARRNAEISASDDRMDIMAELMKLDRPALLKIANDKTAPELLRAIAAQIAGMYA